MKSRLLFSRLLVFDLYRGFSGIGFIISIGIASAISLIHIVTSLLPVYIPEWPMPISLYARWIGGEGYSFSTQLLFLIFPLLSALPYGASYFDDKKSGYLKQLYIRAPKRHVIVSRYIASFTTGAAVVAWPLLLNLSVSALIYPALRPQPSTMMFTPTMTGFMCYTYTTSPWLYCMVYIVIIAVFYGFFSCLGLAAGTVFKHKVFVLGLPLITYLLMCFFSSIIGVNNPLYIFHPAQLERATGAILSIYIMVVFALSSVLFFYRGLNSETY